MSDQVNHDARFVLVHPEKGRWLGSGWWSKGPEAKAVNCAPTYTRVEMAARSGAAGLGQLAFPDLYECRAVEVADKDIDMAGHRISEGAAVRLGLVESEWSDKGVV